MIALLLAVMLQWDAPADSSITGYKLYWGTVSGLYVDSSNAGNNTQETLDDNLFTPGITYYFIARSYNSAGLESVDSNEISWTRAGPGSTPSPIPSPPQNLRFELLVINGSGDGSYEIGTLVLVVADRPPRRYAFSRWGGDWIILDNPFLRRTIATIPSRDVSIEALYEPR